MPLEGSRLLVAPPSICYGATRSESPSVVVISGLTNVWVFRFLKTLRRSNQSACMEFKQYDRLPQRRPRRVQSSLRQV